MRCEWVALRRPVGRRYERIGGFGYLACGGADVRALEYTRVIPHASRFADTHALGGFPFLAPEFPASDSFLDAQEFRDG